MVSALDHRRVAGYLRELDAALTGLPAAMAAELTEQIRAHLEEALPPEADDQTVTAVLAALGPAALVADAARRDADAPGTARRDAGTPDGPTSREPVIRRVARSVRKVPMRIWLAITVVFVAIAVPSGTLIYWHAQPGLQFDGSFSWWGAGGPEVDTQAAGATQETVPIRPGQLQGFAIAVYNPSDLTQVIVGSAAGQISPGAPTPPQIAVSTRGPWRLFGSPDAVRYRIGGPIPPHSYRWVRVFWRSYHCYLQVPGSSQGITDLVVSVKTGWVTRTEDIQLPAEFAVSASAASAQAAYCQNRQPTP
jgi:hypothetical protein